MKRMLVPEANAIKRMNAAVAKDDHFMPPTRPRQCSEHKFMANQAPVADPCTGRARGAGEDGTFIATSTITAGMVDLCI